MHPEIFWPNPPPTGGGQAFLKFGKKTALAPKHFFQAFSKIIHMRSRNNQNQHSHRLKRFFFENPQKTAREKSWKKTAF